MWEEKVHREGNGKGIADQEGSQRKQGQLRGWEGGQRHRWELPGNYPVFTVVMVIYHYVERIWRILVTPIF